MKTIPFTTITAGLAVMLAARANAIEAPADDAPPPPMVETEPAARPPADPGFKPEAKVDTAYLGVVTAPIPDMLAAHLRLKTDEGVIVKSVMPDGPAAKAGVAVHDVITGIGGRPIGSHEDLSKEVAAHKPGEAVHLDLIHEGKPAGADITLGVRPAELAAFESRPLDQLKLEGIPEELAERVRDMIQGNLGRLDMRFGEDGNLEAGPQLNEAMRDMKRHMEKAMEELDLKGIKEKGQIDVKQGATIKMLDGQGSIELKSVDGGKEVTTRDKDNKITWTGPWDTEQDKAAAPEDVRQRVERLNIDTTFEGNGLRLRMLPNADPRDGGE